MPHLALHIMAHPFGVVGLILNTIGSALLIFCPPGAGGFQPDGSWFGWFHTPPTAAGKRRYLLLTVGFRAALVLLVIGFALQLVDLLTA